MDIHLSCTLCKAPLYITDQCLTGLTYHCSSPEARFWDFDRGSLEQIKAKEHWDKSKEEIPNLVQIPGAGASIQATSKS